MVLLLRFHRGSNILIIIHNIPQYSQFRRRNNGHYLEVVPYKLSSLHHHQHTASPPQLRQVLIVVTTPIRSVSAANVPCLIVPIESCRVGCALVMVRNVKRAAIRDVLRMSRLRDCVALTVQQGSDVMPKVVPRWLCKEDDALHTVPRKKYAPFRNAQSRLSWEGCVRSIMMRLMVW